MKRSVMSPQLPHENIARTPLCVPSTAATKRCTQTLFFCLAPPLSSTFSPPACKGGGQDTFSAIFHDLDGQEFIVHLVAHRHQFAAFSIPNAGTSTKSHGQYVTPSHAQHDATPTRNRARNQRRARKHDMHRRLCPRSEELGWRWSRMAQALILHGLGLTGLACRGVCRSRRRREWGKGLRGT